MKRLTLFLSLVTLLPACAADGGGGVRIGYGQASRIARDADVPGRNVLGQCLPFARALHAKFQAAGIPSRIIQYSYESSPMPVAGLSSPPAGLSDVPTSHAVVAYQDRGRTYVIDNQSWVPTWVHEGTAAAVAQRFSGMNVNVRGARIISGEANDSTRREFARRGSSGNVMRASLWYH